jgi:hypothetical protein
MPGLDRHDVEADGGDAAATPDRACRHERVGEPVVRADPAITGERASEAVDFDPDDPESLDLAAETVARFVGSEAVAGEDNVAMLRSAAACAALVRGLGSYRAAAARVAETAAAVDGSTVADRDVPISVLRKWARVHDLPQSVRRHVARGTIAPSAAKHVARVDGPDRLDLAWAVVDHDLTVREVRRLASEVNDGTPAVVALRREDVEPGSLHLDLPPEAYRELRRTASMQNRSPDAVVAEVLSERFTEE